MVTSIIVEPILSCPRCHIDFTMDEGTRCGMQCADCGCRLEVLDGQKLSHIMSNREAYNTPGSGDGTSICVAELWLPAHNEVDAEAVSQFVSSLPAPVSLEYFGSGSRRTMLIRAPKSVLEHLASKVCSMWPNASVRILSDDPVSIQPVRKGNRYNLSFNLGEAPYLPLRTWETFLRGDPVHTLLSTTLSLHLNERIWFQLLVVRKGRPDWLESVQRRLKAESQRGFLVSEDGSNAAGKTAVSQIPVMTSLNPVRGAVFLTLTLAALVIAILVIQGRWWISAPSVLVLIGLGGFLWRYFSSDDDPWQGADLALVRQKVIHQDIYFQVAIRASVCAASSTRARELLERLDNAMSQYAVAGGNRLALAEDPFDGFGAWPAIDSSSSEGLIWLGPDELAGFWHPPVVNDQVSPGLVPVRGVEVRAPDPDDVRGFYEIGKYFRPDGHTEQVNVSQAALKRNILLVGKPGTGKTNLMMHLALAGMQDPDRPAIVIVDPHGDMAKHLYGAIDGSAKDRVIIMDVGDQEYVLPYNPLDPHRQGWDVQSVTNSIVDIGQALWTDYWGPRMQNVLKRGVQLLVAANVSRRTDDLLGLSLLASVLNINHDTRMKFIETELEGSPHHTQLAHWFYRYYKTLTPYTRETIIQSVLYKAHRFEEIPMLPLFSCPRSALDLRSVIEDRKILIVNTRMSKHGTELSNFVGSLIVNILLRELARQGEEALEERTAVMVIIDEFQTFTGVPWQELLAQMRKYGGRVVIGTQSFGSLRQNGNGHLPGIITSGVHSLFAFLMNGEDADYLTRYELSREKGGPGPDTLTNLEPFRAYVRMVREDGGLTRPFYFESAPPPPYSTFVADEIWKKRAAYSIPYETALRETRAKMSYLDRYAGRTFSQGSGAAKSSRPSASLRTAEIASVLLEGGAGEGALAASIRDAAGSPWEDGSVESPVQGESEGEKAADTSGIDPLVGDIGEDLLADFEDLFAGDRDDFGVDAGPEEVKD